MTALPELFQQSPHEFSKGAGVVLQHKISWNEVANQCVVEFGFFGSFVLAGLCQCDNATFLQSKNPLLQTKIGHILRGVSPQTRRAFRNSLRVRADSKIALLKLGWVQDLPEFWLHGDLDISLADSKLFIHTI